MKYTEVKNPMWTRDGQSIVCDVTFEGLGTMPFAATLNDVYPHVIEIYNRCVAGDFGPIADYVLQHDEGPQPIVIPEGQTSGAQTF